MIKFINPFACFFCLLLNSVFVSAIKCPLPDGCLYEKAIGIYYNNGYKLRKNELTKYDWIGICDINNNEFEFQFKNPSLQLINGSQVCDNEENINNSESYLLFSQLIFRWTSNDLTILDQKFNASNVNRYFKHFNLTSNVQLTFMNVKGFDVNIFDDEFFSLGYNILEYRLINCRLDFYFLLVGVKYNQLYLTPTNKNKLIYSENPT